MIPTTIAAIVRDVAEANPERSQENLPNRILKLIEELGELAQAYLHQGSTNRKKKTWADVQEEAADVLIIAVDIALTRFADEDDQEMEIILSVEHALPRINTTFDWLVVSVSRLNGEYARNITFDREAARSDVLEAVCHAFALNTLVHKSEDRRDQSAAIAKQVAKKLRKWKQQKAA